MPDDDPQLKLPVDNEGFDEGDTDPVSADITESAVEEPTPPSPPVQEEKTPPPPPPSVRELAGNYGVDLSSYEDDSAAIKYLAEQAKAAKDHQELAQYGQEYIRHAADGSWQEYQNWKQQKAEPAPEEPKSWDPPEWNPNWLTQVTQDEAGVITPNPARGGNQEIVAKVNRYLSWRHDQQEKFWNEGPEAYTRRATERIAAEQARKIVEAELSKYGEQLDARHFITNNKNWLYEADDAGQIKYQDNRPLLSQEGQVFFNALQRVDEKTHWTQADKQEYALEALTNYRQMQAAQKPAAGGSAEAHKESQLAKAAGFTPQSSGSETQSPAGPDDAAPPQNQNLTFREMLAAEFKAAGIDPNEDLVKL
jgi:hypothetical protein